jgi:histone H1/5
MSYKAGIIKAITELKDRTGSSSIAIKKHMQANMGDKKWQNGIFLKALKDGVTAGDFVKTKSSYKLSAAAKTAAKKAAAPKKPAAPKKKPAAPKKKTAPKKAVSVDANASFGFMCMFI